MPAPVPYRVADLPAAAPGPWTLWRHFLGGDDILIQADAATAVRFMIEVLDLELSDDCECECGCGPIWDQSEGENEDGSYSSRPVTADEVQGERCDGTPRVAVYLTDQVTAALA